ASDLLRMYIRFCTIKGWKAELLNDNAVRIRGIDAFKMLQFEPEMTLECNKLISERINLVTGPGVGISFHYGPDYTSDLDNRGPSFFAVGPLFSWQTGIAFKKEGVVKSVVGLKAFYVPFFAKDRSPGTVLGGALLFAHYL
ncbi:MAG: hypothetical protein V2B15_12600, partial [Bacteroidota bacterium]